MASPSNHPKSLFLSSSATTASAVCLLFLLCFQHHGRMMVAEASEFDMWALALYRSAHVCSKIRDCCFENECCRLRPLPEFTIHSFWPIYSNFTWPWCCGDSRMNQSKIATLIPELVAYWPTVECSPAHHLTDCKGAKSIMWEHEWEFHGTCASPVPNDQYSYFSKGIELYHKYDVAKLLNRAGFVGSNTLKYPLKEIFSTIEKFVGAPPIMECENGSLLQIRLCFEKDFTPCSCGTVLENPCPKFVSLKSRYSGEDDMGCWAKLLNASVQIGRCKLK